MKRLEPRASAFARAALAALVHGLVCVGGAACTIQPATGDGSGGSSTGSTRTLGDQCEDVVNAWCYSALNRCAALAEPYTDCTASQMALCCSSTACDARSTISESTVTACVQTIQTEDCYLITQNSPGSCLQ
jgi:hypothetical protein